MAQQGNILILTSYTGGGHVSLAQALRDRLAPTHAVEIVDPQPRFLHLHYRLVSRYALWLWSAEFRVSDAPRKALLTHRALTYLLGAALTDLLERMHPDLIITTYPLLTYEVMQALRRTRAQVPFVTLFSDPNKVHATWLTECCATAMLAPTHEIYVQAITAGFAPERLHLVGWPVREQFSRCSDAQRSQTLTRLGLAPDRFTVFLQGGGEGAARFSATVERVLAAGEDVQVILATGTNRRLWAHFQGVKNLYALPFTAEIAPFMAAADVIMGKAGPNMLFEAVMLGKPFIATTCIPGQEEANLEFISRHKLGWVALTSEQQCTLLAELLANRTALHEMAATVDAYRRWNAEANEAIVPVIESLLK
jgi:UDP-N-acetylglucosamine:LPS N-acetylglucosamine transferase